MLLGSVPSPPRKPRSWISTQSARQITTPATTPTRVIRGRATRNAAPIAASAITTTRFTATGLAASNAPKLAIHEDSTAGCGVWLIC